MRNNADKNFWAVLRTSGSSNNGVIVWYETPAPTGLAAVPTREIHQDNTIRERIVSSCIACCHTGSSLEPVRGGQVDALATADERHGEDLLDDVGV